MRRLNIHIYCICAILCMSGKVNAQLYLGGIAQSNFVKLSLPNLNYKDATNGLGFGLWGLYQFSNLGIEGSVLYNTNHLSATEPEHDGSTGMTDFKFESQGSIFQSIGLSTGLSIFLFNKTLVMHGGLAGCYHNGIYLKTFMHEVYDGSSYKRIEESNTTYYVEKNVSLGYYFGTGLNIKIKQKAMLKLLVDYHLYTRDVIYQYHDIFTVNEVSTGVTFTTPTLSSKTETFTFGYILVGIGLAFKI